MSGECITHNYLGWAQEQRAMSGIDGLAANFSRLDTHEAIGRIHRFQSIQMHVLTHRGLDFSIAISKEVDVLRTYLQGNGKKDGQERSDRKRALMEMYRKLLDRENIPLTKGEEGTLADKFMELQDLEKILQDPVLQYSQYAKAEANKETTLTESPKRMQREWMDCLLCLCREQADRQDIDREPTAMEIAAARNIEIIARCSQAEMLTIQEQIQGDQPYFVRLQAELRSQMLYELFSIVGNVQAKSQSVNRRYCSNLIAQGINQIGRTLNALDVLERKDPDNIIHDFRISLMLMDIPDQEVVESGYHVTPSDV